MLTTLPSTPIEKCVCCGNPALHEYLDLGIQPPPNAIHDNITKPGVHPLKVNVCTECWHSQLTHAVDAEILFANYPYRTGVSETLQKYYYHFARDVIMSMGSLPVSERRILDIGCNDGTLLKAFKEFGWQTYGVDPCRPGEDTPGVDKYIQGYWSPELVEKENLGYGFTLITGTNVFAHTPKPLKFLYACKQALAEDGTIILEFPYQLKVIQDGQFDTIYFEHVSYFTVHSLYRLAAEADMYIDDLFITNVHGGSLRVFLKDRNKDQKNNPKVKGLLEFEDNYHMRNIEKYTNYARKVYDVRETINAMIADIRKAGYKMVGFGASGKGTVLLNYCEIDLEYIIDQTPGKIGKYSPGRNIPIVPLTQLAEEKGPLCVLVLVWNCLSECVNKINYMRKSKNHGPHEYKDKCLIHVPTPNFFNL